LLDIGRDNNIALFTLNNPPVNALSSELIARLKAAFQDLSKENNIKTIIITGAGKTFCAGADIKEMAAIKTRKEGELFAGNGQGLMDMIEGSNIPGYAPDPCRLH